MMKSWSPSKESGSCGPIVDGPASQTVSEENSQSIQNRGQNCLYPVFFWTFSPVVYWILDSLAPAIWRPVPGKRAVESWEIIGFTAVFGLF